MFDIDKYLYISPQGGGNWFIYKDYYKEIARNPKISKVAEVGVWKGHSISYLVQEMIAAGKKDIQLFAVDIWNEWEDLNGDPEQPYIYQIYNRVLEVTNTRPYIQDIKCRSDLAAVNFEDKFFDFVYIDANHSYENVKKDILAWLPKVKVGGIIAGHDYYEGEGVKVVVDELIEAKILPNVRFFAGNVWHTQL